MYVCLNEGFCSESENDVDSWSGLSFTEHNGVLCHIASLSEISDPRNA